MTDLKAELRDLTPARSARLIALQQAGDKGLIPPPNEAGAWAFLSTRGWAVRSEERDQVGLRWRFHINAKGEAIIAAAKKGKAR
jgi:hypothetical protein